MLGLLLAAGGEERTDMDRFHPSVRLMLSHDEEGLRSLFDRWVVKPVFSDHLVVHSIKCSVFKQKDRLT